jgi:N-methylhydantoinase A
LQLDGEAARKAVETTVAEPLGLDPQAAADGILQVACEQMHDLIRRTTVQRGHDPADFVLYAFGGAGPQYAGRYAAGLGVSEVVIPALAAEFSAFGAVASELKAAVEQDLPPATLHDSLERVNDTLARLETNARSQLTGVEGVLVSLGGQEPTIVRTVGLRFYRQIHRIDVAVPPGLIDEAGAEDLLHLFRTRYERIVGQGTARLDTPIEAVTVTVEVIVPVPATVAAIRPPGEAPPHGARAAWFEGLIECPVYRWEAMGAEQQVKGPAFIESDQTTVVVYPGQSSRVDSTGNVHIEL